MARSLVLSFRDDVVLIETDPERIIVDTPRGKLPHSGLSEGLLVALRTLADGGATEDTLGDLVLEADGLAGLAPLYYYIQRYERLGLIRYTLLDGGEPLAVVMPMVGDRRPSLEHLDCDARVRLSRFAY